MRLPGQAPVPAGRATAKGTPTADAPTGAQ